MESPLNCGNILSPTWPFASCLEFRKLKCHWWDLESSIDPQSSRSFPARSSVELHPRFTLFFLNKYQGPESYASDTVARIPTPPLQRTHSTLSSITMTPQKLTYLSGDPNGVIHAKSSLRNIGALEVLVRVTHSGLCGTDIHDRASGCGLGHEGVGIIEKMGAEVTYVQNGQRVGWG
jgi:hypothetical protein